ncbi:MAG: sensor histidine kinase [Acidimicrobiia bacterium]
MGTEVETGTSRSRRTVVLAIAASVLLVLFVTGLAFTNSIGAARVTDNALALHWTNASIGTSALTRAGLVQAVTFLDLRERGLATAADVEFAMEQVEAAHEELGTLLVSGQGHASLEELESFVAAADQTRLALDRGDLATARALVLDEVEASYIELSDSLRAEQADIQSAIEEGTAMASRLNNYVLFFLLFAVPASAIVVYFLIVRRQVKELRLKTELELEAERAISRAKDQFIAGISHELRTPLTSIYGFAELLTDNADEDTAEPAQIIANEAAELTRMVDDLLAASRLESTGVEVEASYTNLDDVIGAAVMPFEKAGAVIDRDPSDVYLSTDAARLRHVLANLLSNATRHGGGSVGIEVAEADGKVEIEVWDNGPGVPDGMVEKLFDPFIHGGAAPLLTGSVGLGLAVASRLTALLGGTLGYQRFGSKTYFVVTLPVAETEVVIDASSRRSVADMIRSLSE